MSVTQLVIPGEFTTLNQYIYDERGNKFAAAKTKERETLRVKLEANSYPPVTFARCDLVFSWYRCNKRTDPDNIAFADKFILDGLQAAGVIPHDRWSFIASITHLFDIDTKNPRVEIRFENAI
jgi:hypothetical protein